MSRKKLLSLTVLFAVLASVYATYAQEAPRGFTMILGPRIGASYVLQSPEEFSASVQTFYPAAAYFPVMTLFGITIEQRILLGQTRSHFAFQEVVLVAGLEQGIALPEGVVLIGYRDFSGFELGVGPIVHLAGIGVIAALGWTFSFQGVFIPVDLSCVLPSLGRPASFALTTGFNFEISRTEEKPKPASE